MGACNFVNYANRGGYSTGELVEVSHNYFRTESKDFPDAKTAFEYLADNSRWESGHSYSGEIGMKHDFVHIATVETVEEADALIDWDDPRISDKWGPAGCMTISTGDVQFLFYGWASS